VDPRAGLDAVARRKNPSPCRESNAGRPAPCLVSILTYVPRLTLSDESLIHKSVVCKVSLKNVRL